MRLADSLKWALYDRILAWLSFLVGALFIVGGLFVGAGNTLADVAAGNLFSPARPDNVAITAVGVITGIIIWQLGRATARHHAVVAATEEQITEEVNTERLKSEVLSVLDGRLSDMEADLEEVRRQAARIEQKERVGEFEFGDEPGAFDTTDAHTTEDDDRTEQSGAPTSRGQVDPLAETPPSDENATDRDSGADRQPSDER